MIIGGGSGNDHGYFVPVVVDGTAIPIGLVDMNGIVKIEGCFFL